MYMDIADLGRFSVPLALDQTDCQSLWTHGPNYDSFMKSSVSSEKISRPIGSQEYPCQTNHGPFPACEVSNHRLPRATKIWSGLRRISVAGVPNLKTSSLDRWWEHGKTLNIPFSGPMGSRSGRNMDTAPLAVGCALCTCGGAVLGMKRTTRGCCRIALS